MMLYRPVGLEELRLVYAANMRAFPPRLPEQPIFYPVTTRAYARQIAREWNTTSGTCAGFVTRFAVSDAYLARFERRVVGSREHEELWVPAEELPAFNTHIEDQVAVTDAYFGDDFRGHVCARFALAGKAVRDQFVTLAAMHDYSKFDFSGEIAANHEAIFLGLFFWEQADFSGSGVGLDLATRDRIIDAIRKRWAMSDHASIPLGIEHEPR